jgi:hypothetical protein
MYVLNEAADQPAWRSLLKYCCQESALRYSKYQEELNFTKIK